MYIGKKLRELRHAQNMTLLELSRKSGVQLATLSRIENMKMTSRVESHMAVAKALGVDITQLYADVIKDIQKIDHKTTQAASDVFRHSEKSSYEILTTKVLNKKMMPILLKIEPGGRTNSEQNMIGSEKFIFVLDGKIEAKIGEEIYSLSKNNSLYFDASIKNYFVNEGKSTPGDLCPDPGYALTVKSPA